MATSRFNLSEAKTYYAEEIFNETGFNETLFDKTRFDYKSFAKDVFELYLKDMAALIAHELGHAFASKLLLPGSNPSIDLGKNFSDKTEIFKIPGDGKSFITIHSPIPIGGYTKGIALNNSPLRNITVMLSGPICGALTYYLLNLYSSYKLYEKHNIDWTWGRLLRRALLNGNMWRHLVNNLVPIGKNDGGKIVEQLDPSLQTTNTAYTTIATAIAILITNSINNKISKKLGDDKYLIREEIASGNQFIMKFAHKLAAAAVSKFKTTDFNEMDAVYLLFILFSQPNYFQALNAIYTR